MSNYELAKSIRTVDISSVETSIIPIDGTENSYVVIPPTGGIFTAPIKVLETSDSFLVTKFDYNDEDEGGKPSFMAEYLNLVSDDTILKPTDVFDSFDYKVDKDWCIELLEDSSVSIEEFLIAQNELLEEFPNVPTSNSKKQIRRDTTPDDILTLISDLKEEFRLERILESLINFSTYQFDTIHLSKNKISTFKQFVE